MSKTGEFTDIEFQYAQFGSKSPWIVKFAAFVTQFQDNYSQKWNSTQVYGRPDSIETYGNTVRNISLGWDVPSDGPFEGYGNMIRVESLLRMLYPVYKGRGGEKSEIKTIERPPLLRLKFANLIRTPEGKGLLGHVQGFTFAPDFSQGVYNTHDPRQFGPNIMFATPTGVEKMGKDFVNEVKKIGLIPKVYKMQCQFTVLHEHDLGFGENKQFLAEKYPYGFMKSAGPKDLTGINKIGTRPGKNTSIPSPAAAELGYSDILKSQKPQ
tara:strand:- start:392 stop:1192 length:801 start_codon:yes stop_codon:yes gene_type:complete